MRVFLFAVLGLSVFYISGCDRPQQHSPEEFGTLVERLPDIPEARKPFELPEVEGVDTSKLPGGHKK